jgi:hypothetical protein
MQTSGASRREIANVRLDLPSSDRAEADGKTEDPRPLAATGASRNEPKVRINIRRR